MLVVLQMSKRISGAMHTSHLGLVPPKLNEEQSQLLWLFPSPGLGAQRPVKVQRDERKYLRTIWAFQVTSIALSYSS